jgi:hypothetical protein
MPHALRPIRGAGPCIVKGIASALSFTYDYVPALKDPL